MPSLGCTSPTITQCTPELPNTAVPIQHVPWVPTGEVPPRTAYVLSCAPFCAIFKFNNNTSMEFTGMEFTMKGLDSFFAPLRFAESLTRRTQLDSSQAVSRGVSGGPGAIWAFERGEGGGGAHIRRRSRVAPRIIDPSSIRFGYRLSVSLRKPGNIVSRTTPDRELSTRAGAVPQSHVGLLGMLARTLPHSTACCQLPTPDRAVWLHHFGPCRVTSRS